MTIYNTTDTPSVWLILQLLVEEGCEMGLSPHQATERAASLLEAAALECSEKVSSLRSRTLRLAAVHAAECPDGHFIHVAGNDYSFVPLGDVVQSPSCYSDEPVLITGDYAPFVDDEDVHGEMNDDSL